MLRKLSLALATVLALSACTGTPADIVAIDDENNGWDQSYDPPGGDQALGGDQEANNGSDLEESAAR
jgi:hypothetical protein